MESRWYLDDCTEVDPDGPSETSLDSISFNGQLVNGVGPIIYSGEKGIVFLDEIESDEEDQDLDSLDSICKGHGISISSDPQSIRFEIFSTRIDQQSKRVFYCVMVLRTEMGIDKEKVSVERRFSDFAALYKALKKDVPMVLKDINFPGKVLGQKSNLNPELIESRRMAFQKFLQTIYLDKEVQQHSAFREFFYLPGLQEATDHLIGGELSDALELFLNSLHLQVKLCDKVREVIATLAAVVVVLEAQDRWEDAERYAMAALELLKDDYLCPHMIPLLDTAAELTRKLEMDKKPLERHLSRVQKMTGIDADHTLSLRALVVMRFNKAT